MNILRIGCTIFLLVALYASDAQARLMVILSQQTAGISTVDDGTTFTANDGQKYFFDSKAAAHKGLSLEGQQAHILFYEANGEKYCVDLRSAAEPKFKIPAEPTRGRNQDKEALK